MAKQKDIVPSHDNLDDFAMELFNVLRYYGYVPPTSERDAERFLALHGSTPLDRPTGVPEFGRIEQIDLGLAAFNDDVPDFTGLSDSDSEDSDESCA